MRQIDPPDTYRESTYLELIESARAQPGEWFDVTEDLKGAAASAFGNLYGTAGRYFTPLKVLTRKGRVLISWRWKGSDE